MRSFVRLAHENVVASQFSVSTSRRNDASCQVSFPGDAASTKIGLVSFSSDATRT